MRHGYRPISAAHIATAPEWARGDLNPHEVALTGT